MLVNNYFKFIEKSLSFCYNKHNKDKEGGRIMSERYYTVAEIAKKYGVSKTGITKWIREGKLEAVRLGNVYRISESALVEFLKGKQV
jgi:excisionase family DNA binding protein